VSQSPPDRSPIAAARGNAFLDGLYQGCDDVYERLYGWLVRRLRTTSPRDEESAQHAFEKMLSNLDKLEFTHEGEVKRWLLVTAVNHSRDEYRRRSKAQTLSDGNSLEHLPDQAQRLSSPDDLLAVRQRVKELLLRLKPEDRRLLYLRSVRELEWLQIAAQMDLSSNAARTRYSRLRRELAATPIGAQSSKTPTHNARGAKC
jgi:RNA polymerase sigma factor (sigma-70 family)